mgnify:CR=1 FL=1
MPNQRASTRRRDVAVAVTLALLGAWARWTSIPRHGFFFDDAWVVVGAISLTPGDLLVVGSAHPGFTTLLHVVGQLVGHSTWAMSAPSLIVGLLGPPIVYIGLRALHHSRVVSAVTAIPLLVNPVHVAYSGRPKSYVFDFAAVMLLAAIIPRMADRRWRWSTGLAWAAAMIVVGTFSGYLTIATALASVVLLVHPRSDTAVRLAAVVTQGIVQLVLYLASRNTADMDGIQEYQEVVHDGHLTFTLNPLEMGRQLIRHLGRIAEVYPGGPTRLMQVVGVATVSMLLVAALGRGTSRHETVASRFLIALMAFAAAAATAGMVPFGNSTNDWISVGGSHGGRHSLWLVPAIAVGGAGLLQRFRNLVGRLVERRNRATPGQPGLVGVRIADACLIGLAALAVLTTPDRVPYPHPGSQHVVREALAQWGDDGILIVVGDLAYILAAHSDLPRHLVATPDQQVGFTPEFDDPLIHALGPWTTTPIDPAAVADAVGSNDRVVVLGVWIGPSQTTVIDATLQELGFVRTSGLLQDYTVTVWERLNQE